MVRNTEDWLTSQHEELKQISQQRLTDFSECVAKELEWLASYWTTIASGKGQIQDLLKTPTLKKNKKISMPMPVKKPDFTNEAPTMDKLEAKKSTVEEPVKKSSRGRKKVAAMEKADSPDPLLNSNELIVEEIPKKKVTRKRKAPATTTTRTSKKKTAKTAEEPSPTAEDASQPINELNIELPIEIPIVKVSLEPQENIVQQEESLPDTLNNIQEPVTENSEPTLEPVALIEPAKEITQVEPLEKKRFSVQRSLRLPTLNPLSFLGKKTEINEVPEPSNNKRSTDASNANIIEEPTKKLKTVAEESQQQDKEEPNGPTSLLQARMASMKNKLTDITAKRKVPSLAVYEKMVETQKKLADPLPQIQESCDNMAPLNESESNEITRMSPKNNTMILDIPVQDKSVKMVNSVESPQEVIKPTEPSAIPRLTFKAMDPKPIVKKGWDEKTKEVLARKQEEEARKLEAKRKNLEEKERKAAENVKKQEEARKLEELKKKQQMAERAERLKEAAKKPKIKVPPPTKIPAGMVTPQPVKNRILAGLEGDTSPVTPAPEIMDNFGPMSIVDAKGELPDIPSDYSEDEFESDGEGNIIATPNRRPPRQRPPVWARTPNLLKSLQHQLTQDPDVVFGAVKPCSLEDIFRGLRDIKKYRQRSSSANWTGTDGLTAEEELRYKRNMGFLGNK